MIRTFAAWLVAAACMILGAAPAAALPFSIGRFLHTATVVAAPGGLASLNVGAGWNGTACSGFGATLSGGACVGGTAPADPARTTAKPAERAWITDQQRVAANTVVGVDADALGGVQEVDFYAENGTPVAVTTPTVLVDTDVNGNARKRLGYWASLNVVGALAQHSAGNTVAIYAKAVPNDGTMQARVIGPFLLYPEATANDNPTGTGVAAGQSICPSGCDFTSIKLALSDANTHNYDAPLYTFLTTASYEMENGTWAEHDGGKGYAVFAAAPGVTATISRSAFPTGLTEPADFWDPRWGGIEFRGAGVVLDFKNIGGIAQTNRGLWINGSKVTTTAPGGRDSNYWNKGMRPGGLGGTNGFNYADDATLEFIPQLTNFLRRVSNSNLHDIGGDVFSGTAFVVGNYHNSMNQDFFGTAINALQVSYSGASATATVQKTGAPDAGGGTIVLAENGSTVATIPLGSLSTDTNFEMATVAAAISSHAGWSATALDSTRHSAALDTFAATSAKSTTLTLATRFDIHADWFQAFDGWVTENIILRGNTQLNVGSIGANQSLFLEGATNKDIIFADNWEDGGIMPANGETGHADSHVVIKNNTLGAVDLPSSTAYACDSYCLYDRNVILDGLFFHGAAWPAVAFTNNLYTTAFQGAVSGASYVGNTSMGSTPATVRAANLTNGAAGDGRPKAASTLATTTTTTPAGEAYGIHLTPRAANDAVGAFPNGAPAPSYPF